MNRGGAKPRFLHVVNTRRRPAWMRRLKWRYCRHKPTWQTYAVLPCDATVETAHGTMSARAGDFLMRGLNGVLYVISPAAGEIAYDLDLQPPKKRRRPSAADAKQ